MKTNKGFSLKKCKLNSNGSLTVSYTSKDSVFDGETPNAGVHDDLRDALNKVKYALISSHRLDWPTVVFPARQGNLLHTPEESGAIKTLRKLLNECEKEIDDSVSVTGFACSGEGNTEGVIVTGTLQSKGKTIGIASHRFRYNETSFGFEEQLALDINTAIQEVYQYLFNNKRGDLKEKDPNQTKLELTEGEEENPKGNVKTAVLKPRKTNK